MQVIKSFVCRPEIGPKDFDKLKPEPDPIRKAWPNLQLCFVWKQKGLSSSKTFEHDYFSNLTKSTIVFAES